MTPTANQNKIIELLNLYYDGKTTIDQEQTLIKYFSEETDIPKELLAERDLILAMRETVDIEIPAKLEEELVNHIDKLDRKEQFRNSSWIKRFGIPAIAASIIIAIAIGAFLTYSPIDPINNNVVSNNQLIAANTPRHDEVTDINVAYEKTEMALMMLSSKLNKSSQSIAVADEKINQINDKLNSILK